MSVSSVSSSSIYGQRNVLSGLASGMDTESMIENMTQATRLKIQQQKQKKTLLGWTQEAYRGISSKLIEFSQKYTDYQSDTNMLSPSFFTQSEITTSGKYADLISATGKTSSNIVINGVKQMATAATHSYSGASGSMNSVTGNRSDAFDIIDGKTNVPGLNGGSFSIQYGDEEYTVYLGDNDDYGNVDNLQEALNKALKSVEIGNGQTLADKVEFNIDVDSSEVTLRSKNTFGNTIKLTEVSDNVQKVLGIKNPGKDGTNIPPTGIVGTINSDELNPAIDNKELLKGKSIQLSLNGKNVNIEFKAEDIDKWGNEDGWGTDEGAFKAYINAQLEKEFGSGRVSVDLSSGQIQFNVTDGNSNVLRINGGDGNALKAMGFEVGDGNRLNLNQTLGDRYGKMPDGSDSGLFFDTETEVDGEKYAAGEGYLEINGTKIKVNKDMTMREMINAINNSDAGVTATYSELSDTLKLTAKETGAGHDIVIGDGKSGGDPSLAETIFGVDDDWSSTKEGDKIVGTSGQDAVVDVTVNGEKLQLTRSSNDIEIDGLKIQIKGTFDNVAGNEVTFTSKPKTDEITEGVKSMIEDFNKMLQDVYKQMSTKPNKDYQPLTDEERDELSEEQIEKWEEKAKEGLLFGDSQLRTLHSELRTVFSPGGEMSKKLEKMGITFEWSINSTDGGKIKFDEKAFRAALEENPDMVSEVFTTQESTDSSGNRIKGGIAVELKRIYEDYASTSIVQPGILVARAGSTYSANSLMKNTLQTEIDGIDKILNNLNTKLKTEIDRYNKQFTQLEMLVSQMNSQSASLAGLMGG